MDLPTAAASAAIGAAVAIGAFLTADHLAKAKAEAQTALERGWHQGRESILQNFQANVEPQDFTQVR
jgi:hypothetical protein